MSGTVGRVLDALHTYAHTKANVDFYGARLSPKFLVLDDMVRP